MKNVLKMCYPLLLICLFFTLPAYSQYSIESSTIGMTGGTAGSESFALTGSGGQPTPLSSQTATGNLFSLNSGFLFTLFEENALSISVSPPTTLAFAGEEITVTATITPAEKVGLVRLHYRKGNESGHQVTPMSNASGMFSAKIPSEYVTASGVCYFVEAQNLEGSSYASSTQSLQVALSGEGLKRAIAQPSGSEQNSYRLVSFPLILDYASPQDVLTDDLGDYDDTQWRFFDDTKQEFNNISAITPGKGYWLIVKESGKVIDSGPGKSFSPNQIFRIPLKAGWNLVGNPFSYEIPLDHMHLKSGASPTLRSYIGHWDNLLDEKVTSIVPFEGYAIKVENADTLSINPDLSIQISASQKDLLSAKGSDAVSWEINIKAQCQNARDVDNYAGVSSDAANQWDSRDHYEPPVIGGYVSLAFPHPDWKVHPDIYATDYRPAFENGCIWEFVVNTNIRDVVQLEFAGLDKVPANLEVCLLDPQVQIKQNLKGQEQYQVVCPDNQSARKLKLVAGSSDFVAENSRGYEAIPSVCELKPNFPNPFNPLTTIRFGLPELNKVTVKIYNLLGQEVVTLINNEYREAGYHNVVWNGRDRQGRLAASGIYIYILRSGQSFSARKMVLIK